MRAILILTVVTGAACTGRAGTPARSRAGTISVEWIGKLRGSFSAPATARWCAADTLLEVIAVRGDTTIGLALIARDSMRADVYVVNETELFTPGRPQASVALRMLGGVNLLGFDAMGGQVNVTRGGSAVSGTLDVRLRPVIGTDTLRMKGSFERIPVAPATGVCGRDNKSGGG
jgi:hypothetical protein